jgi:hypothetical protein
MLRLFISRLPTVSPLLTKSASTRGNWRFRYMLKAPRKAYRLYKVECVTPDGEIVWRFKQRTSELRPGERLTLLRLMKDMYLDKLAVAGGQGAHILRRAKRRALREFPKLR